MFFISKLYCFLRKILGHLVRWAKKDPFLTKVVLFVVGAHLLLILYGAIDPSFRISHKPLNQKAAERKVLVKTVDLRNFSTISERQAPLPASMPKEKDPEKKIEKAEKKIEPVIPDPAPQAAPVVEKPPSKPEPQPELKAKELEPKAKKKEPEKKKEEPKPKKKSDSAAKPAIKKTATKKTAAKKKEKSDPKIDSPKQDSLEKNSNKNAVKEKEAKEKAVKEKAEKEKAEKEKKEREKAEKAEQERAQQQANLAKKKELLSAAKEKIAKIDKSHDNFTSEMPVKSLGPIEKLSVEAITPGGSTLSPQEASYSDEIAHRLKLLLRLPQYGEVKVKLTLQRSGKVVKAVIVKSESSANSAYIEKMVQGISFPNFGKNFENEAEHTFLIVLSNEL
jgi:colicin import membrane protein